MKLPSGRCISYPFPRLEPGSHGEAIVSSRITAAASLSIAVIGAWQGVWIENAVQAVARDLFAAALQRLEAAGYPVSCTFTMRSLPRCRMVSAAKMNFLRSDRTARMGQRLADRREGPIRPAVLQNPEPIRERRRNTQMHMNPLTELEEIRQIQTTSILPQFTELPPIATDPRRGKMSRLLVQEDTSRSRDQYASGEREWGDDVAEYIYKDPRGPPYLKVKRTSNKQFPQYHLDDGKWVKGSPKGPKIPYRLPELLAAPLDVWVHLFEGEKDTDNGAALGAYCHHSQRRRRKAGRMI